MNDTQAMEMLSITRNGIPTIAGLLNFCVYPQGFLPELGITGIVVPGTEMGDTADSGARSLDNKRMEGTIANMYFRGDGILYAQRGNRYDHRSGNRQAM